MLDPVSYGDIRVPDYRSFLLGHLRANYPYAVEFHDNRFIRKWEPYGIVEEI